MTQLIWAQSTICSTTTGGNWNDVYTWVGGVVPGPTDHVVINGKVGVGTNITCQNLTVNDSLVNDGSSCWSNRNLYVYGNVINNGFVGKAPHSYFSGLYITLRGDFLRPDRVVVKDGQDKVIDYKTGKNARRIAGKCWITKQYWKKWAIR